MELICYLHPGWEPLIRPAEGTRDWMSATPDSFAYRFCRSTSPTRMAGSYCAHVVSTPGGAAAAALMM